MNNYYEKFEYQVMKTFGVTDTLLGVCRKKNVQDPQYHEIEGAHLQCINTHYAKFEYRRMKTVGVADYTNQTLPMHLGWKKCLSSTPVKNVKISIKCVQNIRCTSLMCQQS